MKLYPITNGTPNNSLEFVAEGDEDDLFNKMDVVLGDDAPMQHVVFSEDLTGLGERRWLIFGPAFKRLVESWYAERGDTAPTAERLAAWLEAELNKVKA